MRTLFTSDTHFGHTNIIAYCKRPFLLDDPARCMRCGGGRADWQDSHGNHCPHPDLAAHDEALIWMWNESVEPDDKVVHLGDVALTNLPRIADILKRLNGRKHLILGNHDRHTKTAYRNAGFEEVSKELSLTLEGRRIKLVHDPRRIDDLSSYDLALCGHVHDHWRERTFVGRRGDLDFSRRIINVGVDVRGFHPVTLEELLAAQP